MSATMTLLWRGNAAYVDDGWKFTAYGVEFFVVTAAPFYPPSSSRYAGGPEELRSVVMHIQPMYSFDWHFRQLSPAPGDEGDSAKATAWLISGMVIMALSLVLMQDFETPIDQDA